MTLRRIGDVGLVGLLYHVPAASHPEFPAVELLGEVLFRAVGAALQGLGRVEKATSVSVRPTARHDLGAIEIMAEVNTKELSALEKVRDEMISVITRSLDRESPSKRSTGHARRSSRTANWPPPIPTASPSSSANRRAGRLATLFPQPRPIEQVTPAQVKEVAEKYFTTSNRTVGSSCRRPNASEPRSRRRPTWPRSSRVTPAAR